MLIYTYDPQSGEYIGSREARPSPLEPGVYLVPANATAVAPPDAQDGCARVWTGSAWEQVEDHRGETVYSTATGEVVPITTPGPLPDGVTALVPGPCPIWDAEAAAWITDTDALAAAVRAERDARLAASDKTQLPDFPLSDEMKAKWASDYRTPLRNLPASWANFPGSGPNDPDCPWPAEPAE